MHPLLCRNTSIPTDQEKHSSVHRKQPVLSVEHDVRHPINVPIVTVQQPCPIFTPTVNLDFNTGNDDSGETEGGRGKVTATPSTFFYLIHIY